MSIENPIAPEAITNMPWSPRRMVCFLLFMLFAVWVTFSGLNRYQLRMTPDSTHYIHAAEQVTDGDGFGKGYLHWPPLYPIAIAAMKTVGLSNNSAVLAVNSSAYIALLLYVAVLLAPTEGINASDYAVYTVIAFSTPVHLVYSFVWSESIFLTVTIGFLFHFSRALTGFSKTECLFAAIMLTLCLLARHIGVAYLAVAMLAAGVSGTGPASRRLMCALAACGFAFLFYAGWLFRTWLVSNTLTGSRTVISGNITDGMFSSARIVAHWLFPHAYPGPVISMLLVGVLVSLIFAGILYGYRESGPQLQLVYLLVILVITYVVVLVWTTSHVQVDPIGVRLLAPVFIPLVVLIVETGRIVLRRAHYNRQQWLIHSLSWSGVLWFASWATAPNALADYLLRMIQVRLPGGV